MLECGLFLWLLNHAWVNDGLPADAEKIERLMRGTAAEFRRAWPGVEPCFPVAEDGRRRNPRQEKERRAALSKSEAARESGRKSGEARRSASVERSFDSARTRASESYSSSPSISVENSNTEKISTRAQEIEPSVEPIIDELEEIYRQAGAPIAEKHKQLAVQYLIGIPPEKRGRVANYCKWALVTGKWPEPSKTKVLLNVLRDGDWDVELTQRVLPMVRAPSQRKSVVDEAEERFLRRPKL